MKFANQKEATFSCVIATFAAFGIAFESGKTIARPIVDGNKSIKDAIVNGLVELFTNKEIPLASPQEDLHVYCVGLLNNWLRRDFRLNGNVKYEGKVGHSDPGIKEARKLLATLTNPKDIKVVEATIEEMVSARRKEKAPTAIDASKLPESLRHLVAA